MDNTIKPKKPARQDWHRADIKCALAKKGWTLRQLALHHDYCGHYFNMVFNHKHFNAQRIIAETIGVKPWDIWPSRYEADGTPLRKNAWLPMERPAHWGKNPLRQPENRVTKSITSGEESNVCNAGGK
jgi:Ner family transcriptional regulator